MRPPVLFGGFVLRMRHNKGNCDTFQLTLQLTEQDAFGNVKGGSGATVRLKKTPEIFL